MSKEYYKVSRKYEDDPELVNIIKETQMCFYTDEVVDKRFYKMESFKDDEKLKGIIAYNKYYYLFDDKEKAYKFNNSRILKSFSIKSEDHQICFHQPIKPEDQKVILFGKELTNGKEWKDFLQRGLELQQERDLYKRALKLACNKIINFCTNPSKPIRECDNLKCSNCYFEYFIEKANSFIGDYENE